MIHRSTLRRSGSAVAVGVLALAIVGGGTATAAKLITGENIKDGTIEVLDLSEAAVDGLQVPGPQGGPGLSGYEVNTYDYPNVSGGGIATVACSEGKTALGGGYWFKDEANLTKGTAVVASFPGRMDWTTNTPKPDRNDGWIVQVNKPENLNPGNLTMYVICATVAH